METFAAFLEGIDDSEKRTRTEEVLSWVKETFPDLETVIKWNQPMFTVKRGTIIRKRSFVCRGISLLTTRYLKN